MDILQLNKPSDIDGYFTTISDGLFIATTIYPLNLNYPNTWLECCNINGLNVLLHGLDHVIMVGDTLLAN